MSATSIEYTITAVEEAISTATGKPRAIAAAYLFELLAWPGRKPEELATLARKKPLAYVSLASQVPHDVVQEMGSEARYDAVVVIEMAHFWGHEGRRSEIKATEVRVASDFHRLRSALCRPNNLSTTVAGAFATGLASGCLRSDNARWAVRRDLEHRLLFATASFAATVYLDFPA